MPRRPASTIELAEWPEPELPRLFGRTGQLRDLDRWESALKQSAPEIASRISDLIQAGCDRRHLLRMFCELHASRRWNSFSSEELRACREAITKAERVTRALAASELRYHLGLARFNPRRGKAPLGSLIADLAILVEHIDHLPFGTNRKESLLRNEMLGLVSRYVEWATGELHDEELDEILPFLIGRDGQTTGHFSMKEWRRSHGQFCRRDPKLERLWQTAVETGVIQEPIWKSRHPAVIRSLK